MQEQEKRKREQEWRKQEMQKQLEYRKNLYKDYPEVEKFEKKRSHWLLFLFLYVLTLKIIQAVLLRQMNGTSLGILIPSVFLGVGMQMIFLAAGMHYNWKLAFVLYGWSLYNIARNIFTMIKGGVTSWETFRWAYVEGFSQYPLPIISDFLSWLLLLLVLGTAMWLTLVPANRRKAEQSAKLLAQMKEYTSSHPVQ